MTQTEESYQVLDVDYLKADLFGHPNTQLTLIEKGVAIGSTIMIGRSAHEIAQWCRRCWRGRGKTPATLVCDKSTFTSCRTFVSAMGKAGVAVRYLEPAPSMPTSHQ